MPLLVSYAPPAGSLAGGSMPRPNRVPAMSRPLITARTDVAVTTTVIKAVPTSTASKAEGPMAESPVYKESPFPKLFRRIKTLGKLQDNWNTYGAAPPNKTALFWAHRVLQELAHANLAPLTISASSDEGIAMFFRADSRRASLECLNSGEILAVMSEGESPPQVWAIPQDSSEIKREIRTIQKLLAK